MREGAFDHMRVLVTGGAGFIGSHTVDRLVEARHDVAVVDNLETGFRANVHPAAAFHKVDIMDSDSLEEVFESFTPEVVIHLAAQINVRTSTRDPVRDAQVNILGSINVLSKAAAHKTKKVVYASTGGAVYGEPEYLPVREDHPIRPISPYGVSKHTVEQYLFSFKMRYQLDYAVLRYPNVYGPRQNPNGEAGVIAIFGQNLMTGAPCTIFGDGEQTRDYVYVEDVADANLRALTAGGGETLNIGSGIGTTVNEVYSGLLAALGTQQTPSYGAPRLGEVEHIRLDPSRARKVLGWSADVPFRVGLGSTIDYLRSL